MTQADNPLTQSADELELNVLLSAPTFFSVPYFQRPYRWTAKHLKEFIADIQDARDSAQVQFLGALILHGRPTKAAEIPVHEIVDGQQRIATVMLTLCALTKAYCKQQEFAQAANIFASYIWNQRPTSQASNLKFQPSRGDRSQFRSIIQDLLGNDGLRAHLRDPHVTFLSETQAGDALLEKQYARLVEYATTVGSQEGTAGLDDVLEALLKRFTVVRIDLVDPTTCSRIFERLNFRGERVSTGDLVRNEVFAKIANSKPEKVQEIYDHKWEPFYEKFIDKSSRNVSHFEDYFFPYGLLLNPNISKSAVFGMLRDKWASESSPQAIIQELSEYQDAFLDFVKGTNALGLPKEVKAAFEGLRLLGAPSAIYPFVMRLGNAAQTGEVAADQVVAVLQVIEGFLARRAVAGIEPTGLHAVFKRLWIDGTRIESAEGEVTVVSLSASTLVRALRSHKTVPWPDDTAFKAAIQRRAQYKTSICNYVLREYERSLGGDLPTDIPWVEHVLPQNPDWSAWEGFFTRDQHKESVHTLANLLPLSEELNKALRNSGYVNVKRERYRNDSMYKTARVFAEEYETWDATLLAKRAEKLAAWAIVRWPFPS